MCTSVSCFILVVGAPTGLWSQVAMSVSRFVSTLVSPLKYIGVCQNQSHIVFVALSHQRLGGWKEARVFSSCVSYSGG
ncbi:hypothetical protein GGI35DRAFT_453686 [Trichoderma velutinum]